MSVTGVFDDSAITEAMHYMLRPFPIREKDDEIMVDGLIDYLYPGKDFEVERGGAHFYIKKKIE